MENNYRPTKAVCTGKETLRIISAPGIFREGGEEIGTAYRAYFKSESGKVFYDDFDPAFWRELREGSSVFFNKNRASLTS